MKKLIICVFAIFSMIYAHAQENDMQAPLEDTQIMEEPLLYRHVLGLNAYPALGIFGGSRVPNMKVFVQYKYLFDNINLKGSINFSDHLREEYSYMVGIYPGTVISDSVVHTADSVLFRRHRDRSYSYDVRFGIEAKLDQRNVVLFAGTDLVLGIHKTLESYGYSRKLYEDKPVSTSFYFNEFDKAGHRDLTYFKYGLDFTFGMDIKITPKFLLTVQYSPELVFLHNFKKDIKDPGDYYNDKIKNGIHFLPYYIDLILAIKF